MYTYGHIKKAHIQLHTMFLGIWVVGRGELFIVLHVNFCVKTLHFPLDFKDSLLASSRPLGSGQTHEQQKKYGRQRWRKVISRKDHQFMFPLFCARLLTEQGWDLEQKWIRKRGLVRNSKCQCLVEYENAAKSKYFLKVARVPLTTTRTRSFQRLFCASRPIYRTLAKYPLYCCRALPPYPTSSFFFFLPPPRHIFRPKNACYRF